ncbi:hypothetical protein IFR05_014508 [Cadophora sp. M221]|nr:hypothetical protein IFR05_014508 [Cadophora sp. M221]
MKPRWQIDRAYENPETRRIPAPDDALVFILGAMLLLLLLLAWRFASEVDGVWWGKETLPEMEGIAGMRQAQGPRCWEGGKAEYDAQGQRLRAS